VNEVATLSALLYQSTGWETGVEVLAHFFELMRGCTVLLEVNTSFLVIFV
jgi:hypothetical protein